MKLAPSCAIRSKKNATKESGRTNLSLLFFCQAYKKIVAQTSATYFGEHACCGNMQADQQMPSCH